MTRVLALGLAVALIGRPTPSFSEPRELAVGVEVEDLVDPVGMPPHLLRERESLLDDLGRDLRFLLEDLGRCTTTSLSPGAGLDRQADVRAVDFIARARLRQLYKSYRNKQHLGTAHDVHISDEYYYDPEALEVTSEPILVARLELGLVEARRGKRFWSGMSDSTAVIPHGRYDYMINPARHPGATRPEMLQHVMAGIMRLTDVPRSPLRYILDAADRWYISSPEEDVRTANGVLAGLVGSFFTELDSHLPLEGRVVELLPEVDDKTRMRLDVGAVHGVFPGLKLDVWRPHPAGQKVGQVQVTELDSATAVARVRKLDRKLRKQGEGVQDGDRVISKKRRSTRTRSAARDGWH